MHLLDLYFFLRDCIWALRAPKASRKWRRLVHREYVIVPKSDETDLEGHELQSISVRPTGEFLGEVRTESEGHIVCREFYFEGDGLVAVREYGWAVDVFLPRRAMVRWRTEIDTVSIPFRRRGRTHYFCLSDSEIERIAEKICEVVRKHNVKSKAADYTARMQ